MPPKVWKTISSRLAYHNPRIGLRNVLLVMAKRPAPGHTKTRLSPPLTPEDASVLYECFLMDTIALMRQTPDVQLALAFLPPTDEAYFRRLAPGFDLTVQRGNDLGARLDNVLTSYLNRGYAKVAAIDSDSPTLPGAYLQQAFKALDNADVVIGPCEDGGYYLIGLRQPAPRLLREVRMSTSSVTADTLALAEEESLCVELLPTWYDVDDGASLARLQSELTQLPGSIASHTRSMLAESGSLW